MKVFVVVHSVHEHYESGSDTISGVFSDREKAVQHIFSKVPDAQFKPDWGWIDHTCADRFTDAWYAIEEWELDKVE